jgi:ABC-2 type transport system ATP-binding protein
MSTIPVIQTHHLTKRYGGSAPALQDLSLTVNPGEIFGYLGPNGAGKSTTIRILMDLIRPTSGTAQLWGQSAQGDTVALHRRIGFMPGDMSLWADYSGAQVVGYFSKVRGGDYTPNVRRLTDRLDLDLSKRIREYSSGNRRKLGLVLALMHDPELLILDEPTSGLDPLVQQTFNELMREQRAAGRTVFLSSHVLSEVQAICDRVAILRHGELKAVETVEKLTRTDFRWVTLTFDAPVSPSLVAGVDGVSQVSAEDNHLRLRLSGDFDPLLRAASARYIVDIHVAEPTLEEIFLAFYGDAAPAHPAPAAPQTVRA